MKEELEKALKLWGEETVKKIQAAIVTKRVLDTGKLRNSIKYVIGDGFIQFTMETYGRYMDEGTGRFGTKSKPLTKRSIPAIAGALELSGWASRKNLKPWAVATNIVKRGGLKPRGFFNVIIEKEIGGLLPYLDGAFIEYLEGRITVINSEE
jgi:hypothetical protein